MDHSFLPRVMWTGDGKLLQHPADLYTSVVVTRSVPAGTSFGPCVFQSTFYDTIAFIAQKSCDKRAKPYVFRVDPEVMRNSALVLSWLRLVQAAHNREEQNTEAFVKAGQLYVRTTRDIHQDEELLVWYDQELSHLLGFTEITRGRTEELRCDRCNQNFNNEYPFLAHCRFLCVQVKHDTWRREIYDHKHVEQKKPHRVTDFHNIARDLEHRKSGSNEDAEVSPKKKKQEDSLYPKGRKNVLLEKTNISDNITQLSRGYEHAAVDTPASAVKIKADIMKSDHLGCKLGAFVETGETKGTFTHDGEMEVAARQSSGVLSASSSAFSLVLSNRQCELKSAFCKPTKTTSPNEAPTHLSGATTAPSSRLDKMTDVFSPGTIMGYNLMASTIPGGDVQTAPTPVTLSAPFHYAPEHWSRHMGAQLQSASSSLTILPPTFTSFGVSVQNWCAKCNLSFRMTSDLVFHMRSHHKKEFAAEAQVRRRREEKLTCPICHEYFRERHHLSRHMTSHN
ncbi:PR domain zinc finger protein 8 [Thalassophryne amazonica]|uniref:PR domain zinc finger protein 8 n=1 Tax=Thalassophryne amazonica TaxID=390379 RepID=UPI001471D647|nr:PR domain zinc finger protein 8 [Thalassophryne amazonica]XP_034041426.1 PR domain zinc finger protein 8 [Thalassophryne amazonica]